MNYTIESVAKITGISAMTLRNWEKRYHFLAPKRLDNGFRVFSDEDVSLLRQVNLLLSQGIKISQIAEAVENKKELPKPAPLDATPELRSQIQALFDALVSIDQSKADFLISTMNIKFSTTQMLDFVYQPLLHLLGEEWEAGRISIAQEHFSSAYLRIKLAPYINHYVPVNGDTKTALCATLSGELHEGGILLLASYLKLQGWNVIYLGASLPTSELASIVKLSNPDVVCLSAYDSEILQRGLRELSQISFLVALGGPAVRRLTVPVGLRSNIRMIQAGGMEAVAQLEMMVRSMDQPHS